MPPIQAPKKAILLSLLVAFFTFACGQKGALVLPSEPPPEAPDNSSSAPVTTDSSTEK